MKSLKKALSFLLCAALLLGCGLVPALAEGADAGTPVPAAEGTFSFLNFNVAGLPSLTASSEKAARQKLPPPRNVLPEIPGQIRPPNVLPEMPGQIRPRKRPESPPEGNDLLPSWKTEYT